MDEISQPPSIANLYAYQRYFIRLPADFPGGLPRANAWGEITVIFSKFSFYRPF
jgi:hypothetical protein